MDLVNHSFGSGGMTCGIDQNTLPYFVQTLKRKTLNLPTKVAVPKPMKIGNCYFLNENVTVDEYGNLMDFPSSSYVWLKKDLLSDSDKILVTDILPKIQVPFQCNLMELFLSLEKCLKHNFIPCILVIAGAAMSFHYKKVVEVFGGCSIVVATGAAATGKSTAVKAGLSIMGCANNNMFVKGTNRALLERSSLSCLPYGIDDPKSKKSK